LLELLDNIWVKFISVRYKPTHCYYKFVRVTSLVARHKVVRLHVLQ